MVHRVDVVLTPAQAADPSAVREALAREAAVAAERITQVVPVRRSIDARSRDVRIRLRADVYVGETAPVESAADRRRSSRSTHRVVVVGSGPAGYFAALELLEHGMMPIVLERGRDVRQRRRDLRAIQQDGLVDPHSNYCFGEGGAGTYSDGKLYTRSHKRGSIDNVLRLLVEHGATPDILVDAHPHIGSNKLWAVVQRMRDTIVAAGGEVHFEAHVTDLLLSHGRVHGVRLASGVEIPGRAVVLATGHSARDVFAMCVRQGVTVQAKPFALGVRIEHPQALIDRVQYRQHPRDPLLPAASYSLVCQAEGRGVFSFCMCPGGIIVPAATSPGEIVVNGMSMSRRDSPFANSGTVVAVEADDWQPWEHEHGPLAGVAYQRDVEQRCFSAVADGSQRAPAQRVVDFLAKRTSASLPATSYIPGLASADLRALLPAPVIRRLSIGMRQFARTMRGYDTAEAVMVATESRTSSPVRIPRTDRYEHPGVGGLYPCGEGAGYAGGIVSAALDGQNVARAVAGALA